MFGFRFPKIHIPHVCTLLYLKFVTYLTVYLYDSIFVKDGCVKTKALVYIDLYTLVLAKGAYVRAGFTDADNVNNFIELIYFPVWALVVS